MGMKIIWMKREGFVLQRTKKIERNIETVGIILRRFTHLVPTLRVTAIKLAS